MRDEKFSPLRSQPPKAPLSRVLGGAFFIISTKIIA